MPTDKKCKFCNPLTYAENSEWCDKNCDKLSEAVENVKALRSFLVDGVGIRPKPQAIIDSFDLLLGAFEK